MLQKVSEQRKESIKSQRNTDLSRIIEEQTQYRQALNEIKKEVTTTKEKTRLTVTGALKMVLEDNQKTLELLIGKSKGKSSTEEEKLNQEDQRIQEVEVEKPNFEATGFLAELENKVNGSVLKFTEPEDAAIPKQKWKLYPYKGDKALEVISLRDGSCFLAGKDAAEEKASIEQYKKDNAEYWKEIIGSDGDFSLKEEKED
jgi:hypothetical protein